MSPDPIPQLNTNTVHAETYIENKGFNLPDHIIRRALVDIARDKENCSDSRVVLDNPADDGIVAH